MKTDPLAEAFQVIGRVIDTTAELEELDALSRSLWLMQHLTNLSRKAKADRYSGFHHSAERQEAAERAVLNQLPGGYQWR